MFSSDDILYEDNHLLVVNKRCGDLVQPDPSGQSALEDQIKAYIKRRDAKPGEVFLGVVHRIDRPVSGAVLFAKTSKALVRLNEMIRSGEIRKTYWAVTEQRRDGEIQMQQAVDRNHGGADRSFHREHHVARHFDKLPDEAEIRAAVRHDLRAVGAGARHELAGDVGHHDRDGQH